MAANLSPEWRVSKEPVDYPAAVEEMEKRIALIEKGNAPELLWLLEHPALYTMGTSAHEDELLDPKNLPVFKTGRGGKITWHGPGQRVIYALCDLRTRDRDVKKHVARLEEWIIRMLQDFGIKGERRAGRIGIWVVREKPMGENYSVPPPLRGRIDGGGKQVFCTPPLTPPARGGEIEGPSVNKFLIEEKIAAIGVRVRRWIAYHGLALNVNPDLSGFNGIVPCGLPEFGVTSMHALGVKASMAEVDAAFRKHLDKLIS
jgi:lipoyl(octanoyl) transferase